MRWQSTKVSRLKAEIRWHNEIAHRHRRGLGDYRARLAESLTEIPNLEIVGLAETEQEAVTLLRDADWDAAILDLQLKKGTGLGVLKALALVPKPAHSKVIVFTNYAFPQYRERSLTLGADYFFDKSREFHRVREVLSDLAVGNPSGSH